MGMTIDEDIEMLEYIRQDFRGCRQGVALQDAINTMRKYQKIREIVGNYGFDTSWLCLKKIREVIEDGSN